MLLAKQDAKNVLHMEQETRYTHLTSRSQIEKSGDALKRRQV
jgi:hypothetical protein